LAPTIPSPARSSARALAAALVSAAWVAACAPSTSDDPETQRARDGTDLVSHEGDTELLAAALVGTSGAQLSLATTFPDGVTPKDLGDGARAFFFPRGCVTPSHDSKTRTVTYTFEDCAGPFGLRKISGSLTIVYARGSTGTGISLTITADKLSVGRATLRLSATADIRAEGTTRTSVWHAEVTGQSARDRAFSRVVDRTLVFSTGESCITSSGTSTGTVGDTALTVTVDALKRCRAACPEAGGSVTIAGEGSSVSLAFDGTSEAKLTVDGKSKTIALACAK